MVRTYRIGFATIAAYAILVLIGSHTTGLEFTGWHIPSFAVALLTVTGLFYLFFRPCQPLSEAALYAAFWIAFVILGCVLTYIAAAVGAGRPLMDATFARIDAMLQFDWIAWVEHVRSRPTLNFLLRGVYFSLLPQIVGSLLLFAMTHVDRRNEEFLLSTAISLLLTCLLFAMLPAIGPWIHFDFDQTHKYAADMRAIRSGDAYRFAIDSLEGIICLPSFHTTLAILCTYAHRGLFWSFPPVLILNCVMLVSIPSEGGHYLTDMIAGAAVALVTLTMVRQRH